MFRIVVILTILGAALAGCAAPPPPEPPAHRIALNAAIAEGARNAVKARLKDPFSSVVTPISAFRRENGLIEVCGVVNAKNSFGAFTGDVPFRALLQKTLHGYSGKANIASPDAEGIAAFRAVIPRCG